MKKATFVKFLCLAIVALMLVPMIIACGETQDPATSDSTGTSSSTPTESSKEKITVDFRPGNSNAVVVGEKNLTLDKGSKLTWAMAPTVTLKDHVFKGWSFTPGQADLWDGNDRVVNADLILYAIWETAPAGGTTDSSKPAESNPTDSSKPDTGNTDTPSKVGIIFDGNGVLITVGDYIEIDYGAKLTWADTPTPTRAGYTFNGWSYDPMGKDVWTARSDTFTDAETTLYAIWVKDGSGTTDSSTTNPPAGSDDNTTDSSTTHPPVDGGDNTGTTITIEYEVGQGGDFENLDDFEKEVPYGDRFRDHPTPINSNPAMLFMGWYTDAACTSPVSNSTKYTEDTILYACWLEQAQCSDGTYNHNYSGWEDGTPADCVTPGTTVRYCLECNKEQSMIGAAALGHKFGTWTETFMAKERVCSRLGCGETERVNYKNITTSVLGNAPAEQIDGNTEAFYNVPFTNLINNKWDEGFGQFIGPRGNGEAYVQFNFKEATEINRVYFKGFGVTSINAYVLYEGEDEFQLLGIYGSVSEKEATPFYDTDPTRKVVAVKFVEENPPQGTSQWQEVAFVKIVDED